MPTYDYRCEADDKVYEVKHGMNESVTTWGDLCMRLGIDAGEIAPDTRVKRLATGGNLVSSSSLGDKTAPCGAAGSCSGGACGFNA